MPSNMKDAAKDAHQENYLRALGMCMFISMETGVDIQKDSTIGRYIEVQLSEAQGDVLDILSKQLEQRIGGKK
jgi:hypothetical protein